MISTDLRHLLEAEGQRRHGMLPAHGFDEEREIRVQSHIRKKVNVE